MPFLLTSSCLLVQASWPPCMHGATILYHCYSICLLAVGSSSQGASCCSAAPCLCRSLGESFGRPDWRKMLTNEGDRQKRSGITIYGELTMPEALVGPKLGVQPYAFCCAEPY